MRIAVIGGLALITAYATWYLATALVYWWLLVTVPIGVLVILWWFVLDWAR